MIKIVKKFFDYIKKLIYYCHFISVILKIFQYIQNIYQNLN